MFFFIIITTHNITLCVWQESTCKHGKRRRVARRTLNALGGISGLAGFVNDEKSVNEIKLNMKFAQAYEEMKAREKKLKQQKVDNVRQAHYQAARAKVKLAKGDKFCKSHAKKLTIKQIQAVAFIDCAGVCLNGKVAQLREQLENMLSHDLGVPDYPSQDIIPIDDLGDSDDTDEDALLSFIDLEGGMNVDVWWEGDKVWYAGRVTGLDRQEKMFEVFYPSDKKKLWHYACDYSVRRQEQE